MKPDSGTRAPAAGTVAWLDRWVGQARPGARQEIGPLAETSLLSAELGDRVRQLVRARLILAPWVRIPEREGGGWVLRLQRRDAPLPASYPILPVLQRGL